MAPTPTDTIIRDDAALLEHWAKLMGTLKISQRTLWLTFLQEDGSAAPVLIPIDDLPVEPHNQLVSNLSQVVSGVIKRPIATVAILLARPGSGEVQDSDRHWEQALRGTIDTLLSPWPIHLATKEGVVALTRD